MESPADRRGLGTELAVGSAADDRNTRRRLCWLLSSDGGREQQESERGCASEGVEVEKEWAAEHRGKPSGSFYFPLNKARSCAQDDRLLIGSLPRTSYLSLIPPSLPWNNECRYESSGTCYVCAFAEGAFYWDWR